MEERRQSERCRPILEDCISELLLEVAGDEYEVVGVQDASPMGVGIETISYVDPGEPIILTFDDGVRNITVKGEVSWCDEYPNDRGYYQVGLTFEYTNQSVNDDLYAALSSHEDEA